jgi:hypothetical protein
MLTGIHVLYCIRLGPQNNSYYVMTHWLCYLVIIRVDGCSGLALQVKTFLCIRPFAN